MCASTNASSVAATPSAASSWPASVRVSLPRTEWSQFAGRDRRRRVHHRYGRVAVAGLPAGRLWHLAVAVQRLRHAGPHRYRACRAITAVELHQGQYGVPGFGRYQHRLEVAIRTGADRSGHADREGTLRQEPSNSFQRWNRTVKSMSNIKNHRPFGQNHGCSHPGCSAFERFRCTGPRAESRAADAEHARTENSGHRPHGDPARFESRPGHRPSGQSLYRRGGEGVQGRERSPEV